MNIRLGALEEEFEADAICIISALFPNVDDLIRVFVEGMKQKPDPRPNLVVFLTTRGGVIDTTQRIAETFRHHYDHVSFVVPNYAFSAGTVLAMSGDDIYMDYYSRLGPIDPQVPNAAGRYVPALGYLAQWEELMAKGDAGTLTQLEFQIMMSQFDQAELYMYRHAREQSIALLEHWLAKYKFKDWATKETSNIAVTPEVRAERAKEIGEILSDAGRWHSHSQGISMEVLRAEVNLRIDDLADRPSLHLKMRQYDGLLADYMQRSGLGGMLHVVGRFRPLFPVGQ